ncbi:nuclear transport factor 2 family protein [Flavobacterium sp. GT3R68]|uniref:nuclear transport factor 2 family protein n=1 Tax=Flavobacterium sp. GT3R68 TaxID=2594437 RepID=UPI000F88B3A8|nr:nuclear transport factor 2 family protein [Flavobacterium sp. GT3R68]RTY96024.1 hypothetical protein EKL32_05100 [Flavobacterium sp. GSN2]TRW93797.1 nuclear transport factor 2 family protein [Flavobacterium sp. GT3R68]
MKKLFFFIGGIVLFSSFVPFKDVQQERAKINATLDAWHKAAAETNFNEYFGAMTEDAIFIGTDPTENWNKTAFIAFAKPYFNKGKAWNFKTVERHIYFSKDKKTAWFDELLDTQMKICRGSGVLELQNGKWKIAHYVLSIAIPNDSTDEVVKLKTAFDDALLVKLKTSK